MYSTTGMGSCSALIHGVAAYPKLALLAAGALAFSALGNNCQFDRAAFDRAAASYEVSPGEQAALVSAFDTVSYRTLSDDEINNVLSMLRCDCAGAVPEEVRNDQTLLREVGLIYFASLVRQYGIEEAKRRY